MAILVFRHNRVGLLRRVRLYLWFSTRPYRYKVSVTYFAAKWSSSLIGRLFFERSRERIKSLHQWYALLLLWDDSKVEKSESWFWKAYAASKAVKGND